MYETDRAFQETVVRGSGRSLQHLVKIVALIAFAAVGVLIALFAVLTILVVIMFWLDPRFAS
jgi:hypothetical protein